MDLSLDEDLDEEVIDDAVAAVDAFDNPQHHAYSTMQRYSERLFEQNQNKEETGMNTPKMADKMVSIYKRLDNKRQRTD